MRSSERVRELLEQVAAELAGREGRARRVCSMQHVTARPRDSPARIGTRSGEGGFACNVFGDPPNFAIAARDAAVILIALPDQPERLVPHWKIVNRMWDAYIRVDDPDAIYAEVQEREGLARGREVLIDAPAPARTATKRRRTVGRFAPREA